MRRIIGYSLLVGGVVTLLSASLSADVGDTVNRRLHPGTWRNLDRNRPATQRRYYRPAPIATDGVRRSLSVETGVAPAAPADGCRCVPAPPCEVKPQAEPADGKTTRSFSVEPTTRVAVPVYRYYVPAEPQKRNKVGETVRRRLRPGSGFQP